MEVMEQWPDNHFDLLIADPPYGINVNNNMGRRKGDRPSPYKKAYWDKVSPPKEVFDEMIRVSKNQVIWGANHFISKIPYDSPCWIMWDKGFSPDVSFAQFELAWTSFTSTSKKYDKHPSDIHRIHPTQKPTSLYDFILKTYAKEGDTILDPFVGSGSSRIAAHRAGLDFIGAELDPDYWAAQEKRYKDFTSQLTLF
jgi:site-specific DNA-methyltransferase (adenine-specific)